MYIFVYTHLTLAPPQTNPKNKKKSTNIVKLTTKEN
jgi:hypothetical protein